MESEKYWAKRAEEREAKWYKKSRAAVEKEIADYYMQSLHHINNDIAALYARFAADNELTMAEARKLILGDEYRTWKMDMQGYLAAIEKTKDKKLLLELNTLAMRSRISRLDKLKGETIAELALLTDKVDNKIKSFLSEAFKDNYYHGLFDIGQKERIKLPVSKIDNKQIENILRTPWSGKNYSQRIWNNSSKLANVIEREIVGAIHRGSSIEKISKVISERMNVGKNQAVRLVRTELNYVQNQAAIESIKSSGMEYFIFIATLDKKTSSVCRSHDRQIYPVSEGKAGANIPPLHPNCRSVIAASFGEEYDRTRAGSRIARDNTGQTIQVPADMSYKDWYKVFVDKQCTFTNWKTEKIKELISAKPLSAMNVDDVISIGQEISEVFRIPSHIGDKQRLKAIFSNFREMGGTIRDDQWAKGSSRQNKQMLRNAFSVYPKAWADYLDMTRRKLYTLKVERGFFNEGAVMANGRYFAVKFDDYRNGYVTIHMDGIRKTTPFHEIGHYVEFFNPEALRISKEFLLQRTYGEVASKLIDIFPNLDYSEKEVTKKDDFISPYIGKEYENASEVLSMGLESLFEAEPQLKNVIKNKDGTFNNYYAKIEDDEEYLHLIIGMIALI